MAKRTGPTNVYLQELILELKKIAKANQAPIWKAVAEALEKPRRQKIEVNVAEIERYAKNGETVVVPGVVLAKGELTKQVTVAAWRFSKAAKEKIEKTGSVLTIWELVEKNPKGSEVKIMM